METKKCFHCGLDVVKKEEIIFDDKSFCCNGCKTVYEIFSLNGLTDYYDFETFPGATPQDIKGKYDFLDNEAIVDRLLDFKEESTHIATLYIPHIHCSSCIWILENLHRLQPGISGSQVNFHEKKARIIFNPEKVTLKQIVYLLNSIGYEPYISLDDAEQKKSKNYNKQRIYKLGVAGFCFGNIMMMSFPEYLSLDNGIEHQYAQLFRILNLVLAIPIFFYSASEFFSSAWAGLKQRILNIDAPIVLALIITFARSIYEIATNTGSGYLDSMSGIVFFMLVGRVVQERTYKSISFHRDYKSYFPIAVTVITKDGARSKNLQELKENDIVELFNDEIIPADALVLQGTARIDYSFVTGESEPVLIETGKLIYAGGKQVGEKITIRIVKPVAASYLTSLWNHHSFSKDKSGSNNRESIITLVKNLIHLRILHVYWNNENNSN